MRERIEFPIVDTKATGKRIKELREKAGLSVREIQEYLGMEAPQAIYNWQRGKALPSVDHLIGLSKLFGVPVDEILVVKDKLSSKGNVSDK